MDEPEEELRSRRKQLLAELKTWLTVNKGGFELFFCENPPAKKKDSRLALFLIDALQLRIEFTTSGEPLKLQVEASPLQTCIILRKAAHGAWPEMKAFMKSRARKKSAGSVSASTGDLKKLLDQTGMGGRSDSWKTWIWYHGQIAGICWQLQMLLLPCLFNRLSTEIPDNYSTYFPRSSLVAVGGSVSNPKRAQSVRVVLGVCPADGDGCGERKCSLVHPPGHSVERERQAVRRTVGGAAERKKNERERRVTPANRVHPLVRLSPGIRPQTVPAPVAKKTSPPPGTVKIIGGVVRPKLRLKQKRKRKGQLNDECSGLSPLPLTKKRFPPAKHKGQAASIQPVVVTAAVVSNASDSWSDSTETEDEANEASLDNEAAPFVTPVPPGAAQPLPLHSTLSSESIPCILSSSSSSNSVAASLPELAQLPPPLVWKEPRSSALSSYLGPLSSPPPLEADSFEFDALKHHSESFVKPELPGNVVVKAAAAAPSTSPPKPRSRWGPRKATASVGSDNSNQPQAIQAAHAPSFAQVSHKPRTGGGGRGSFLFGARHAFGSQSIQQQQHRSEYHRSMPAPAHDARRRQAPSMDTDMHSGLRPGGLQDNSNTITID